MAFFPPFLWILVKVWCLRAVLALYEALGVIQKRSEKFIYRNEHRWMTVFFKEWGQARMCGNNSYGVIYPVDVANWCNMISFGLINSNPTERTPARDLDRSLRLQPRLSGGGLTPGQDGSGWKWDINVISQTACVTWLLHGRGWT